MLTLSRRAFLATLPALAAGVARAAENAAPAIPQNQNVKWALSLALWNYRPRGSFTDILDVMKDTGFIGIRLTGYPGFLQRYGLTEAQLGQELSKRGLHAVSISWNGPLIDPSQRQEVLNSARTAMKFLGDLGASHLVVFTPSRILPRATSPAGFQELCDRCNQIGELAGEMGFTAGVHNHMGQMVQTREEIDRFMAAVDPRLFGFSPDTAHLNLAGCDVVATMDRYKERIRFLDYKDSKWTTPTQDVVQPNGQVLPKGSASAKFFSSIYDLGDGQVDFPGCHRVLKSVQYRGWICVDLDTARGGPRASYRHCDDYITRNLEPIYV
jgi:sugar phosphate isomerase/epimerase